eukprot:9817159-Alexandrium_andersonii.AAC.1
MARRVRTASRHIMQSLCKNSSAKWLVAAGFSKIAPVGSQEAAEDWRAVKGQRQRGSSRPGEEVREAA